MNILITGATGNLGTIVVDYFVAKGHRVFALTSSTNNSNKSNKPELYYRECDLTDEAATATVVNDLVKQFGQIDAALLLAGGFAMGSITESSLAAIHKMVAINFDTAYTIARAVYTQMAKQSTGGKIVFVGSKSAYEVGSGGAMLGYTLSKAMLFNLASILNADSEKSKVLNSIIVPSTIDTPMNRQAMPNANFNEWIKPETIAQQFEKILLNDLNDEVIKLY